MKMEQIQAVCKHPTAYFSVAFDNFYCQTCHKGMGQEYYDAHINERQKFQVKLSKAAIEDCDGDDL